MKRREFIKKSVQAGAAVLVGSSVLGCADSSGSDSDSLTEGRLIYQTEETDIYIWNSTTQTSELMPFSTSSTYEGIRGFSLSSDFSKVAHQNGSAYQNLTVSSVPSGYEVTTISGSAYGINDVRYTADDTIMYTGEAGGGPMICFSDSNVTISGRCPTWAGDSNRIAYLNLGSGDYLNMYCNDKSDSGYTDSGYYGGNIKSMSWSPVENKIAFTTSSGGEPNIYHLKTIESSPPNYDVKVLSTISGNYPPHVQFSPDGTNIGYSNDGYIYTCDYNSDEGTISTAQQIPTISGVRVFEWREKTTT